LARIAVFLMVFLGFGASAQDRGASFDAANKLYEQGKFSEAAATYEKLLQSGERSAALYFNLGNAFFKAGQIGRAIAAYHQAESITPRDPDIRANLQFARNQTHGPTLSPNRWQVWLGKLTLNEWTLLAAASIWLWLLLLAGLQWRPALRRTLRGYAVALALASLLLSSCLAVAFHESRFEPIVIVTAPDAAVHNGPLEESQNAFTVHDGAELRVLDQKDDWLQVSADPRCVGWLRREQVIPAPRD
jgi:tetratricopeptide (TPR) repeat protein